MLPRLRVKTLMKAINKTFLLIDLLAQRMQVQPLICYGHTRKQNKTEQKYLAASSNSSNRNRNETEMKCKQVNN